MDTHMSNSNNILADGNYIHTPIDENVKPVPNVSFKKNIRYVPTGSNINAPGAASGNRTALGDVTSIVSNTRHNIPNSKSTTNSVKIAKNYIPSRYENNYISSKLKTQSQNQKVTNDDMNDTHLYEEKPTIMDIDENENDNSVLNNSVIIISDPEDEKEQQRDVDHFIANTTTTISTGDPADSTNLSGQKKRKAFAVLQETKDTEIENQEILEQGDDEGDVEGEADQILSNSPINVKFEPIQNKENIRKLKRAFAMYHRVTPDPMDEDTYDVTMAVEYCNDIFAHLKNLENRLCPDPNYIQYQPALKWKHRSILLNWLVQVHEKFNLLQETLYLTVNIMDRFLSHTEIALDKFHLVGSTCLFIASKYEEINCIVLKDLLKILESEYTEEQVVRAEKYVLCSLQFELGWPGPMSFLRKISKADDYDFDTRTLSKYLLETTIMDPKFVSSPPSWLAAGAYFLSLVILQHNDKDTQKSDHEKNDIIWSEKHVYYSGYTESQVTPAASLIAQNCRDPQIKHPSIYRKYSQRRHRKCSQVVDGWISYLEEQQRESQE